MLHQLYLQTVILALVFFLFSLKMVSIRDYFKGKKVFITGATGFIGKVLIEKLLRSCPEIDLIYCLIRQKKGKHAEDRLSDLLNDKVCTR